MKNLFFLFFLSTLLIACQPEINPSDEVNTATFALSDTMLKTTTTEAVVLDVLRNEMTFYGKITADNNNMIEIYPVVGGNVSNVFVELGDYVKKGDLLAVIKSTEVAGFDKDYMDAKNDVIVAKNNLKVAQELYEGKLNTDREVIEAKSVLEKANAQLKRMEETFKIYNLRDGSTFEVRSPISGFIIQKNINQDMQLRSDRTDNIFDIAKIDDVWAIANVNESDIADIRMGVDAYVTTLSYKDKVFKGNVDKIFNVIDPITRAMKVRIKLKNENYFLKPEMRAFIRLEIVDEQQDKRLVVPAKSVIFDNNKSYVMIFKDRYNIETREVDVYRTVGKQTYIESGVKEGEKVITNNQLLIYDALND